MAVSQAEQQQMLDSEDTGLQEHNNDNCLYCAGLSLLGFSSQNSNPRKIVFLEKLTLENYIYKMSCYPVYLIMLC